MSFTTLFSVAILQTSYYSVETECKSQTVLQAKSILLTYSGILIKSLITINWDIDKDIHTYNNYY